MTQFTTSGEGVVGETRKMRSATPRPSPRLLVAGRANRRRHLKRAKRSVGCGSTRAREPGE